MALKIISISIDEEVIKKADEIVKIRPEIRNRSHLIETLILKDYVKAIKMSEAKQ
jgi:metal-responsive CopG/Arc/MetJ family transcriptional regulator